MKFLDQAKIYVRSGDGGAGCVSFRREKFVELGGPNGGDGGCGGDVVIVCADGLNTLIDFRYRQHFKAKRGIHGMGQNRTGAAGADVVIAVPAGTQVLGEDRESLIADMTIPGQRVVIASGGRGGRGNTRFKTSTNRAPRRADPGRPGEEYWLWLRLKLIAEAGLVGLPNAGKSTLLSKVSQAHPKIADYPFTTLHPHLGVVRVGDDSFVLADLPGLVEGAHEGKGLGDRFLGHVERCRVLVHLVDGTAADPVADYRTIRGELSAYGAAVAEKPSIAVLTKSDLLPAADRADREAALRVAAGGASVMAISGATGDGVDALLRRLMTIVIDSRAPEVAEAAAEEWRP